LIPGDDLQRLADLVAARRDEVSAAIDQEALADWLYRNWYINPPLAAQGGGDVPFDHLGSALNALAGRAAPWEENWIVLSVSPDGSIVAARGAQTRWQPAGQYAARARFGLPPVPGEQVSLPLVLAWIDPATGQWAARSAEAPAGPLVRFYFNADAAQVGELVSSVLVWLIGEGLPFSLKCPGTAAGFARADALVLYLEASGLGPLEKKVRKATAASGVKLGAACPALTKKVADGVALAEDPGDGRSFGRSRCEILAPAVAEAIGQPRHLAQILRTALLTAGLDPDEPWKGAA